MPTTYRELPEGWILFTFADLEGQYGFLERSLVLAKKVYQEKYPLKALREDDFSIVETPDGKCLKYPDNVIIAHIGDLTDKTCANKDSDNCYNMELVKIFNTTHNMYEKRFISLIGNRETTKIRLAKELNVEFINQVFKDELALSEKGVAAASRPLHMVWVDRARTAKNFLMYLKESREIDDATLQAEFAVLTDRQKVMLYTKWMLANSCGAPDFWDDTAKESHAMSDEETLECIEQFYCSKDGPYANFLSYSQISARVGKTLLTHSGLDDNSYILPKTLLEILTEKQRVDIFGEKISNALSSDGKIIASNIDQLLLALNTWFERLLILHFSDSSEHDVSQEAINDALSELIKMGLPKVCHNGESLINVGCTDKTGAYGNPINEESHVKLMDICAIFHGHMPAKQPRFGVTHHTVNGNQLILQWVNGDTGNYRKGFAAAVTTFSMDNGILNISSCFQGEESHMHSVQLPSRNEKGHFTNQDGIQMTPLEPRYYIGQAVSIEDTGWNVVEIIPSTVDAEIQCRLFRQQNTPPFAAEYHIMKWSDLLKLLNVGCSVEPDQRRRLSFFPDEPAVAAAASAPSHQP